MVARKKQKKDSKRKNYNSLRKKSFKDIISENPEIGEILMKKGMHCAGCPMAQYETLEQGARMHGIKLNDLIKEIKK
jgi:hybrid cluster-associated redox disulfide protein